MINKFLPNFLKRTEGLLYDITSSINYALTEVLNAGKLLQSQMMANRLSAFPAYYSTDQRKQDLNLLGLSRFLFKRIAESWADFETRLSLFPIEVKDFGTKAGLTREINRTGLDTQLIEELTDDRYRWILENLFDQCPLFEDNISHIFNLGHEDQSVRQTRVYSLDDSEIFSFVLYLDGATPYSKNELQQIIKFTKPAYTKCYCFYPSAEYAEVIL
jgi:hypothetical protein